MNEHKSRYMANLLQHSILSGDILLAYDLLDQGTDVNLLVEGASVLHVAAGCDEKCEELIDLLLKYGADVNICSQEGVTPVSVAALYGRCEVVKKLMLNGADPNLEDQDGKTSFDYATESGCNTCLLYMSYYSEKNELTCASDDSQLTHQFSPTDSIRSDKTADSSSSTNPDVEITTSNTDCSDISVSCSDNDTSVSTSDYDDTICELYSSGSEKYETCVDDSSLSFVSNQSTILLNTSEVERHQQNVKSMESSRSSAVKSDPNNTNNNSSPKKVTEDYVQFPEHHSHVKPGMILPSSCGTCGLSRLSTSTQELYADFLTSDEESILYTPIQKDKKKVYTHRKTVLESADHTDTSLSDWCPSHFDSIMTLNISDSLISAKPTNPQTSPSTIKTVGKTTPKQSVAHTSQRTTPQNGNRNPHISAKPEPCAHSTMLHSSSKQNAARPINKHLNIQRYSNFPTRSDSTISLGSISSISSHTDSSAAGGMLQSSVTSSCSSCTIVYTVHNEDDVTLVESLLPQSRCDSVLSHGSLCTPQISLSQNCLDSTHRSGSDASTSSRVSVCSSIGRCSDNSLQRRLHNIGDSPGPITNGTRALYERRLQILLKQPQDAITLNTTQQELKEYPLEIQKALRGDLDPATFTSLEEEMCSVFSAPCSSTRWREGTKKASFCYLLLDPRVTLNLPQRAKKMDELDAFRIFIRSVFYVGKGLRSRPYSHFKESIKQMNQPADVAIKGRKVAQILNIWNDNLGVVLVHIFHNIIPAEAYTREACMITALGLKKLTNKKAGEFYGSTDSWFASKKRQLGVYLLQRAFKVFMADGERQIRPNDVKF